MLLSGNVNSLSGVRAPKQMMQYVWLIIFHLCDRNAMRDFGQVITACVNFDHKTGVSCCEG